MPDANTGSCNYDFLKTNIPQCFCCPCTNHLYHYNTMSLPCSLQKPRYYLRPQLLRFRGCRLPAEATPLLVWSLAWVVTKATFVATSLLWLLTAKATSVLWLLVWSLACVAAIALCDLGGLAREGLWPSYRRSWLLRLCGCRAALVWSLACVAALGQRLILNCALKMV